MGISRVGTTLYVADTGNHRIQRFDTSTGALGGPPYAWGTYGAGEGQFNEPQGVAVDSNEAYLFVADTKNNRIQAINITTGAVASVAGTLGSGTNQFSSPKGIAVIGTTAPYRVFVADTGNNRVVEYSFNPSLARGIRFSQVENGIMGEYGNTLDNTFNQPNKIHIDANQNIYVTDTTNRIQKYDNGRNFLQQWSVQSSRGTTGITTWTDTVYVIEPYHQIDEYAYDSLSDLYTFSSSFSHESNQPVDVAIDLSGNIYINNATTNTVQKFNSTWVPQAEWAGNGSPFSGALGIGVNTGGEVCVADTGNNRIQRFQTNGTYMSTLPVPSVTPYSFGGPKDVANESTGKMYVADTNNNRILKYKSDNTFDWAIGLPTPVVVVDPGTPTPVAPTGPYFLNPYGITVDSQNKIYVADSGHHRILKFDANGLVPTMGAAAWGEYGSADDRPIPQFDNPQGMAIEETGTLGEYFIYVADTGNNRIQRFDQDGNKTPETDVWGVYGTEDGQFNEPRNIALDSSNRIYVSEVQNRRVQVFGDADENAGLTVIETGATAVTEDGSVYDSYSVKLNSQPSANVSVNIVSSDSAQLDVSSSTLTFTPYNWNVAQVVTVIPVHDFVDRSTTQSLMLTHTSVSADPNYHSNGEVLATVNVTYTDTDTAGATFSKTTFNVDEDGTTDTYTLRLNSKPTDDVVVTITSSDGQTLSDGYNPLTVTFTPSNWNVEESIIVSAVHDYVANGSRESYFTYDAASSDLVYDAFVFPTTIYANITDTTDVAGVTISAPTIALTEGGTARTYTVVLNSKPAGDVVVTPATASGTTDLSITPENLTFTPDTYNIVQTVTVTAPNDHIVNTSSPRNVDISHTASSTDPDYGPAVAYTGGTAPGNVVRAAITDIDVAGLVLSSSNITLIEDQGDAAYTMALRSKPTSDILYELSFSTTFEATTSGSYTVAFTPDNWNVPQTVTLTLGDADIYSTHSASLIHTIAVSSDVNYPVGNQAVITVTARDADEPGVAITLPNGVINLTEYGIDDKYYIKLKSRPTANVTVTIDGDEQVTASPSSLIFTPENWNTNQIATLSALNDYIVEGNHTAPVVHRTSSTDSDYNGLSSSITVNIVDDDSTVPGIQITQTNGGTEVTEAGTEDTYTMVLTSRPNAYVRIKVLSNNWEATTSGALFTFLPTNWSVPQTVHVVAKDDPNRDGTKTSIFQHIVTSLDAHYGGMSVETVTVTVHDNDEPSTSASNAKPPSCGSTPPSGAPHLFQIDSRSHSSTLYFTPIRDNISYYFIAYGYKPGDIRFGTSFDFGSYDGVIDHTIQMLNPGETYYYKVRGGNGCATGEWSNTLAGTTVASGSAGMRTSYAPATATYAASGSVSGGGSSSGASHPIFSRNMYVGTRGADVRSLQMYLNQMGYTVAQSGPGSPGNETDLYGPLTSNAVRRLQEANYQSILSPLGYSSGTGIFGPSTRNWVNAH